MILTLSDGKQLRGDLLVSARLRYDMAPIPVTLESDIRLDASIKPLLSQGSMLSTQAGDQLRIIKSTEVVSKSVQGDKEMKVIRVTALLDACYPAALVRSRAIIKEGAALSEIYRAAGCSLRSIDADLPVTRFYCPVGETPTFQIARILQEEGGGVRWKNGRLQFMRLIDIFRQKPSFDLPVGESDHVDSGFLERHEVPWFFSLNDAGGFVMGNRDKPRVVRFAPHKDVSRLYNMTRSIIHRKSQKTDFDIRITAGDLANVAGEGKMTVVTAAHVFESGTDDGGAQNAYTRLWLGSLG